MVYAAADHRVEINLPHWLVIKRVTLKMHDLKMTDRENSGSGKCKSGK